MPPTVPVARVDRDFSSQQLLPAQLRLLYANANLGVVINILAATVLGGLQWDVVARPLVFAWWFYILLVSVARTRSPGITGTPLQPLQIATSGARSSPPASL